MPLTGCQAQAAGQAQPHAARASNLTGPIVPPESAMERIGGTTQRLLLSALEADASINKGAWKMNNLATEAAPASIVPKFGQAAIMLRGEAEVAGAKGDFGVHGEVPGKVQVLGAWVHLAPDSNVAKVGFQFTDSEGESFLAQVPADWQGWKWVEVDLQGAAPAQAYDQADKNKKVDAPLRGVNIAWFSKAAGPSSFAVDALVAATELAGTPASLSAEISGTSWGETNTPLATQQIVLTNFAGESRTAKVDYVVQQDSSLFSAPAPDAEYGTDHAIGAKSWTEAAGRKLEEGALTDGREWTNASLPWGSQKEAVQYVDLGQERLVSRLAYQAADANWAWKVDVSASADGKDYQPVAGLQNIDTHGKWGRQQIAIAQPFRARFLRLRHHNGGADVNQISMPSSLSVYDGVGDEKWELPNVGATVAKGSLSQPIAARSFGAVSIAGDKPLAPGAYLIAARVQDGTRTQMLQRHFMVMPAPLASVANSRFGLNTSNYLWASMHRHLGIGWVRFENLKWPMVSPRQDFFKFDGVPPWNVPHDDVMAGYRANGLSVLPFLFQTADYASSAPADSKRKDAFPPRDNALMADFVFQTVARYGSKKHPAQVLKTVDKKSGLNLINTFEIWNEPNLTDPGWGPWVGTSAQYNEMFRVAAQAVKRADPNARVTNGGTAGIDIETMNTLLAPYADGKKPLDFVDILNVHYYSGRAAPEIATNDPNADRSGRTEGARTFEDDLRRLTNWRDTHKPQTPIWMTETGYDSAGPFGTDERTQAARLPRVVMMALASGIEKVIVYRESGSTASMHAASGVLRNDDTLKPSWFTYATLIRELDGAQTGALRLPYPDPNVRLYAWTRGGETILSAWAIEGKANLSLKLGASIVTDAFGKAQQTNIAGALPLSVFPTYIKKIGNPAALQVLVAQAKREDATRKAEQTRLAKMRAYLFDFGTKNKLGTIDIGDTRTFVGVLGTEVYDEAKGYGFSPGAAGADNSAHWISDALERDSTRMNPEHTFRLKAKPGRYQLRIGIGPQANGELKLQGAVGGDKVFPITKDGPPVSAEIEVGDEPLSISNTAYGDLRWLSLVEQS